jgi:TRAP-type transport system small permease protein
VSRFIEFVDRIFMGAVAILMAIIVVTIACDVAGRYGFGKSLLFSNELSRLSFIWMTFLTMPLGISKGLHVAITSVPDNVSPFMRSQIYRIGAVATIVLMVVVFLGAWVSIGGRSSEMLNTLPISAAWFYYPLAIGSAWSVVHLLFQLVTGVPAARATDAETLQAPL